MARIIGGIGASHTPTIGFAKDRKSAEDPAWTGVFNLFAPLQEWLQRRNPNVLLYIYNDHVTSFFFDHYSPFVLGVDDRYVTADEGGGAREHPAVSGDVKLARHIASSLFADEFDISTFQHRSMDHGLFSPYSMMTDRGKAWNGSIVPLQVGVLQFPIPTARRCYKLGKALRKAIESYPDDIDVAIVATGGLSHQVHGERAGFNNVEWDERFLDLLEHDPASLAEMTHAEYAELGGLEGAEVIMWLIMRGALSPQVTCVHRGAHLPSMTNIATVIYEDDTDIDLDEVEKHRRQMDCQLDGIENIDGTHPFTLEVSHRAYRLNDFLHRMTIPEHRLRFVNSPQELYDEFSLNKKERELLDSRNWIGLIHYGAIFFGLEKLAAVLGMSNGDVYAQMRGESVADFQKSRNIQMNYSVAGNTGKK
jgi:gallate dioxygenase